MNCKQCGEKIPIQRLKILPNSKECVKCSTTEAVGCVDMVFHKTGNTIQILPKSDADKINKLARRTTFGAMSSLKGGSGKEDKIRLKGTTAVIRKSTEDDFKLVGEKMMYWLELGYINKAIDVINSSFQSRLISAAQLNRLRTILDYFKSDINLLINE
jgi:hypothetical protein